jgi:hypothetical protein
MKRERIRERERERDTQTTKRLRSDTKKGKREIERGSL